MRNLKLVACAVLIMLSLTGCIPLMIGGYVGYQMSKNDDHTLWCSQHVGDPTCHP